MTDEKKLEFLENAIQKLNSYSTFLNEDNLEEFENFKVGILNSMNEDEKIRFRQISFYTKEDNLKSDSYDDLPF